MHQYLLGCMRQLVGVVDPSANQKKRHFLAGTSKPAAQNPRRSRRMQSSIDRLTEMWTSRLAFI